ncbi:MAG: SIS domain-containing protein [Candidatus Heimdallarchaeota archaeon]|nr:MAG: SIS domain-containing protein [Candidatus Heimdallarchaeota archaeon]
MSLFLQTMDEILRHLKEYYQSTANPQKVKEVVQLLISSEKIFIYGAGRSGMVGRMFAQRLMHLNLTVFYLSETITPAFAAADCLVVISGSGESISPKAIVEGAKKIGGKVVLLTANSDSTIGHLADFIVVVKGQTKVSKQEALAPFTSLFDITALVVLDSMTREIMNVLGKTEADIHRTHATLE